jgi:hypothetical protein
MKRAKIVRHARREQAAPKSIRCAVDDDVIELRALDRLDDAEMLEHVDHCPDCRSRVNEYRAVIAGLKQALEDLEGRKEAKKKQDKIKPGRNTRVH